MAFWNPAATKSRKLTEQGLDDISSGAVQRRSRVDADKAAADSFRQHAALTQGQMQQLGGQLAGMGGQAGKIAAMQRSLSEGSAKAAAAASAGALQNARALETQTIAANKAAGERQQDRYREDAQAALKKAMGSDIKEKVGEALLGASGGGTATA
jgi:hypothetical protein